MKRIVILSIAGLMILAGCAAPRQKLGPHANVYLRQANVDYNLQNVAEALKNYNRVLADNPEHAQAIQRVADINLYYGENNPDKLVDYYKSAYLGYDKAIKIMEQYQKPTKDESKTIREMKTRKTATWAKIFKAGEAQFVAGDTLKALHTFEATAELEPQDIRPLTKMLEIYENLNDQAKAESILLQISTLKPDDIQVQNNMGKYYLNKEDYATALTYFQKVYTAEPWEIEHLLNITICQYELKQYDEAKKTNQLALNLQPENIDALSDAKSIAYKLNDKTAALGYLEKLLEIREEVRDYQEISFLLNELKDYNKMISYAKKWHEFESTNKDPVNLVILGAKLIKDTTLRTQYENILKQMK